jgi:hypothetical protein
VPAGGVKCPACGKNTTPLPTPNLAPAGGMRRLNPFIPGAHLLTCSHPEIKRMQISCHIRIVGLLTQMIDVYTWITELAWVSCTSKYVGTNDVGGWSRHVTDGHGKCLPMSWMGPAQAHRDTDCLAITRDPDPEQVRLPRIENLPTDVADLPPLCTVYSIDVTMCDPEQMENANREKSEAMVADMGGRKTLHKIPFVVAYTGHIYRKSLTEFSSSLEHAVCVRFRVCCMRACTASWRKLRHIHVASRSSMHEMQRQT